jgi:alkylated DNA repair protein (DNA oxidative demethylase)
MSEIYPGAIHLPAFVGLDGQAALLARCRALGAAPAGLYRPATRGGGQMHVDLCCLGMHWNPVEYRYEATRSDHDGLPVQPLPADLAGLARRVADAAGMVLAPDICLMTFYPEDGGLGLHQDKDERPETIAAGAPIVSISLGDSARFRVGGFKRKEPVETVVLASGDAFVLGGPSRLRYHGVPGLVAGTAPAALGLTGRFNLSFRQY